MQHRGSELSKVRFNGFELDRKTGILRRNNERIPVQEKAFQVLCVLLEKPGELVTREELSQRLWGSDTFVDFEDNLNHAISKVREALDDSASNPRFIETLPRRGYRFLAPVEEVLPQRERKRWRVEVVGLLIVAMAGAIWWLSSGRTEALSVAVLPLDNLSTDAEQEYFADGLTEAVITELAKINSLRVISRQSVMQFKGSVKPLPEIAEDLGVEMLVEGSVSKNKDQIHVTVQLISISPERHLWAESYDRHISDIFTIQQEVAEHVARSLTVTLSEEERNRLAANPTQNVQAYDLALIGDHFSARDTIWDLKKAVDYYQQALELDPGYAEALAKSAEASLRLALYSPLEEREPWWVRAEEEALRSLELDDKSAFAHLSWALIQEKKNGDFDSADESYRRSLDLNPQVAETHLSYGGFLCGRGRLEEALTELREAHELDPLGYRMNEHLVRFYLVRGEFDKALEHSRRIFDYYPASYYGPMWIAATYLHFGEYEKVEPWLKKVLQKVPEWYQLPSILLAWSYLYQGRMNEAAEIVEGVLSAQPENGWGNELAGVLAQWKGNYEQALSHFKKFRSSPLFGFIWRAPASYHQVRVGYVLWKLGKRKEAETLFSEYESICRKKIAAGDQRYGLPEVLAMLNAIQGNDEEALMWLDQAIESGWRWYDVAPTDPVWEPLKDDPRFSRKMAEVKAKVELMRSRARDMEQEWD